MGALERTEDGRRLHLPGRALVGRTSACAVRIDRRYISREHAVLGWTMGYWEVRDLGSRNGTFVDGQRLPSGASVRLAAGSTLAFGNEEERWRLVDDDAPQAMAFAVGGDASAEAMDGLLVLPEADRPEVTIFEELGAWTAEVGDRRVELSDGDVIEAGGERWRLHLPSRLDATIDLAQPKISNVGLRFGVSQDEEYVETQLLMEEGDPIPVPTRSFTYLLLVLARLREQDALEGDLGPAEHGWIHTDELVRMLKTDVATLNVHICRARRLVSSLGIGNAVDLIERRQGTGQLRLGVARLLIESL